MASDCSTVSVALFVVVAPHWAPIFCSSQTHLRPLPVQTQGMQLLKLFIQLYYTNSHQQYENKVSHSLMFTISMFTNHHVNQYSHNRHKDANIHKLGQIKTQLRQLGQLYCIRLLKYRKGTNSL